MTGQTIEQLAVNAMIAPVTDWAHGMARDAEIQRTRAMWTDAEIAAIEAAVTFADGSLVTDADRAELWAGRDAAVCRECGGSGAVLDGGRMRDCPDCGGR